MKLKLAVIFGSRTCEHDVSVVSALQAMEAVDPTEYEVIPVYIDRDGGWYTGTQLRSVSFYERFDPQQVIRVLPMGEQQKLVLLAYPSERRHLFASTRNVVAVADVAMPVMHGVNGEDGTLSGMLELFNVPYTCAGVVGSSVGMDKIVMKQFFHGKGFPVVASTWVTRAQWKADREAQLRRLTADLEFPLFVKPANLGSSIGISRATDRASLEKAIDSGMIYDKRVLIERGVENLMEINCSVLGYGENVQASLCEMPLSGDGFLSYEDKYLGGRAAEKEKQAQGAQGMETLSRRIPAPIGEELTRRVQQLSIDIFRALDLKGVVRIDYMVDTKSEQLYVNEVNTIPGSLSFYLWEPTGLPYARLIDTMVECAFLAHADKNESVFSYDSTILKNFAGSKGGKRGAK